MSRIINIIEHVQVSDRDTFDHSWRDIPDYISQIIINWGIFDQINDLRGNNNRVTGAFLSSYIRHKNKVLIIKRGNQYFIGFRLDEGLVNEMDKRMRGADGGIYRSLKRGKHPSFRMGIMNNLDRVNKGQSLDKLVIGAGDDDDILGEGEDFLDDDVKD